MYVDVEALIKTNLYYKVLLRSIIYRAQDLSFIWDIISIKNIDMWIDNFEAANMSEEAALCGLILSYI